MKIIPLQSNETVQYAASELQKYITRMSRGQLVPQIVYDETADRENAIVLGLLEDLGLDTSDLFDPFIEDILDIDVKNGVGYITGSNPRSILMAVYKYCHSAGCRFLRPGPDGDYVPQTDVLHHSFRYRKKADQPFRGECSEGAISYEHMRDTVYWLPKIGMNMYMIEGVVPYTYMHKWYGHVGNTKLRQSGQVTDYDMLLNYVNLLERDIKRVGLQLHTLGHGWMFSGMGVKEGPPASMKTLPHWSERHLAMVNGKREIHNGLFYTHLCYSNPETRKYMVDTLMDYIKRKPHVDFVHAWLADSKNNHCECPECVKLHPSEFYVQFLNELDEALTAIGSKTRIVFIMYVDTERPPVINKLKNPGRFVLLTAIGLHYDKGYNIPEYTGEVPPFVRNQYKPPEASLRLKWHRDWKAHCDNIPSIIFEYRFYTDMYCDLGNMQIARETHRDMRSLDKTLGVQGCMNDQTHRMDMPTSLPMITAGATLFDRDTDFEQLADSYFAAAFGRDGQRCRAYLEELSKLLCPSNYRIGGKNGVEEATFGDMEIRQKGWIGNPEVAEKAARIPGVVEAFLPVIQKNLSDAADAAQRLSWQYLQYHAEICTRFAELLRAGAENRLEDAQSRYFELENWLSQHEMEFHRGFDVFLFLRSLRFKVDLPNIPYYD